MAGPLDGVRVLMIDDEPDTVGALELYLQQQGAEVRLMTGAIAAMKELGDFLPDVIVSDLSMPVVDGYNLVSMLHLLRGGRTIPAIALSALDRRAAADRALAAGFQEFVGKPVEPPELADAIVRLLHRA